MLSKFFEPGRRVDALRDNPAGGLFEGFAQVLSETGYTTSAGVMVVLPWQSVRCAPQYPVMPPTLRSGRFKATDKLIASSLSGSFMRSKN